MLPVSLINLERCGCCGTFLQDGKEIVIDERKLEIFELAQIPLVYCNDCSAKDSQRAYEAELHEQEMREQVRYEERLHELALCDRRRRREREEEA